MAFGINRKELNEWKEKARRGEIAILTHYWYDKRFPHYKTVTKVGCNDYGRLVEWGRRYSLKEEWIHKTNFPHFDLLGQRQLHILKSEGINEQINHFKLEANINEHY